MARRATNLALLALALMAAAPSTGVVLAPELDEGTWQVLTPELALVLEVDKQAGVELPVTLAAGNYWLRHRAGDRVKVGRFTVGETAASPLGLSQLRDLPVSEDPTVVQPTKLLTDRHWTLAVLGGWQQVFAPSPAQGGSFASGPLLGLEAGMHNVFVRGVTFAFDGAYSWSLGTLRTAAVSTPYQSSLVAIGVSGLYEFHPTSRWVPSLGLRVALHIASRDFTGSGLASQQMTTLAPFGVVGLSFRLTPKLSLSAKLRLGVQPSTLSGTPTVGLLEGALMFGYGFL